MLYYLGGMSNNVITCVANGGMVTIDTTPGGFRVTTKLGGNLWEATASHSSFDVVAWHGNLVPYRFDLGSFSPVGAVRMDHPDPSIYTVLSAPLDHPGENTADLVFFPDRWDVTERPVARSFAAGPYRAAEQETPGGAVPATGRARFRGNASHSRRGSGRGPRSRSWWSP